MKGFVSIMLLDFAFVTCINEGGWEVCKEKIAEVQNDAEFQETARELPDISVKLTKKAFRVMSNPRANFERSMKQFEEASRQLNPNIKGHGDYSKIYELFDESNIRKNLNYLANSDAGE